MEYIGLRVRIELKNGTAEGIVSALDPNTSEITLTDGLSCPFIDQDLVKLHIQGRFLQKSTFTCKGTDIKDLRIISSAPRPIPKTTSTSFAATISAPSPSQLPVPRTQLRTADPYAHHFIMSTEPDTSVHVTESEVEDHHEDLKIHKKTPKKKHGPLRTKKEQHTLWANENVNEYSEDFDFQASLSNFDKKKVFEELREMDETLPEHLLVNLNLRNPDKGLQNKIGHRQMVLPEKETLKPRPCFETLSGLKVFGLSVEELNECQRIAAFEVGPNEEQMIENAGRNAAMLALQALAPLRSKKSKKMPKVAIMTGNNRVGAFGLAAGRHLNNHECSVVAISLRSTSQLINTVAYQQKIFVSGGGSFREILSDGLDEFDFIVDAMLGSQQKLSELTMQEKILAETYISSCNASGLPILSLELPSGLDGNTGAASSSIIPKWTLCLGMPLAGLYDNLTLTGELILGDMGIPPIVLKTLSTLTSQGKIPALFKEVVWQKSPFGDKFVVGLISCLT